MTTDVAEGRPPEADSAWEGKTGIVTVPRKLGRMVEAEVYDDSLQHKLRLITVYSPFTSLACFVAQWSQYLSFQMGSNFL